MYSSRRCGGLRTRDDLLGAPISTGVSGMSGSAVGGADSAPLSSSTSPSTSLWSGGGSYGSERNIDTFLVTRDPSARRAVIIEPFRLATTNGVGSNVVDSLPVFCRRTKTTSPSFKVVFFARVRLSARDFIFRFAAASFSRTTLSSTDSCCLTSGSFVCGSRANISRWGVNFVVTWEVQRYARRNFRISLRQLEPLIRQIWWVLWAAC